MMGFHWNLHGHGGIDFYRETWTHSISWTLVLGRLEVIVSRMK